MAKRGPKRTKLQRQGDLEKIARLDRRGYTQYQIAAIIGVTQPQIYQDMKKIRQLYMEGVLLERSVLVEEKCAQLREIRMEAWEAYEASRRPKRKRVKEQFRKLARDDKGNEIEGSEQLVTARITTTLEGRLPANEYLRTVIETLKEEAELRGLAAPKQIDMRAELINWDSLVANTGSEVPDEIEAEILRVLSDPPQQQLSPPNPSGNGTNGVAH